MGSGWKFEVIQKTLQEEDNQLSVSMLCRHQGRTGKGGQGRFRADPEGVQPAGIQQRRTGHIYVHGPLGPAGGDESKEDKAADG